MTDNKDIKNIIDGSELRDMAEFLTNPASKITDCIMVYQSEDELGYRCLGSSSIVALAGLLQTYSDMIRHRLSEKINKEDEDAE
jgi:hypothetical protein